VSATIPMTAAQGVPSAGLPTCIRLPIALWPGQQSLAIDWFTITTSGALASSCMVKVSALEQRDAHSAEVVPINAGKRGEFQLPVIPPKRLGG